MTKRRRIRLGDSKSLVEKGGYREVVRIKRQTRLVIDAPKDAAILRGTACIAISRSKKRLNR